VECVLSDVGTGRTRSGRCCPRWTRTGSCTPAQAWGAGMNRVAAQRPVVRHTRGQAVGFVAFTDNQPDGDADLQARLAAGSAQNIASRMQRLRAG
jgi:hypothetical protein